MAATHDTGPTLLTNSAAVLLALHTEEDGLLTSHLVDRIRSLSNGAIDLTAAKVTATYVPLISAGYIIKERAEEPTKRRGTRPNRIRLTAKGKAAVASVAPLLQRGVTKS